MRARLTTALEVLGILLIAAGCWMILPAIGVIVAGAGAIWIGQALA